MKAASITCFGAGCCDFRFTSSGKESYTALMDYGARQYDPRLGRFIQPDSVVPEAKQGIQAWDRYAYVNNNPVKYTDPSGHSVDCALGEEDCKAGEYVEPPAPGISQEQHERLIAIRDEAKYLSALMKAGKISDVEALALLMDFAAPMYGDDVDSFLTDLGIVAGGLNRTTVINENDPNEPMNQYYVGYDAFDPEDTDFKKIYNPNYENQVRHFLAGASGSANYGGAGEAILLAQEPSAEDDALYGQAFRFVDYLNSNDVTLADAGNWVRFYLEFHPPSFPNR